MRETKAKRGRGGGKRRREELTKGEKMVARGEERYREEERGRKRPIRPKTQGHGLPSGCSGGRAMLSDFDTRFPEWEAL